MLVDVLIVEDEPIVADSAARILLGAGFTVRTTVDAPTALAELREHAVKVVLCDLMLPGDSGFRVLEAAGDVRPLAQVIMITGYATCENAVESFKGGAFDFLPKPFDVDELLATVSRALRFFDRGFFDRGFFDRASGGDSTEPGRAETLGNGATAANGRYALGRHAWATKDADGSATLGLGGTFPGLLGPIQTIEIPQPDDHILQCRRCALIRGQDRLEHRVWSPLSGRVIAVNRALESEPNLIERQPWQECWLLRVVPENPAEELSNLVRVQIA